MVTLEIFLQNLMIQNPECIQERSTRRKVEAGNEKIFQIIDLEAEGTAESKLQSRQMQLALANDSNAGLTIQSTACTMLSFISEINGRMKEAIAWAEKRAIFAADHYVRTDETDLAFVAADRLKHAKEAAATAGIGKIGVEQGTAGDAAAPQCDGPNMPSRVDSPCILHQDIQYVRRANLSDDPVLQALLEVREKIDDEIGTTIQDQKDEMLYMRQNVPVQKHLSLGQLSRKVGGCSLCPCWVCFGHRVREIENARTLEVISQDDQTFNEAN